MYDESEYLIVNSTKMVKNGTMDDVYILEKVYNSEIKPILFIQSTVPQIKEFSYNLRYKPNTLTSPYMKEFEDLLIKLVFFIIETGGSKDAFTCDGMANKKN
jgi:hypothetical protein